MPQYSLSQISQWMGWSFKGDAPFVGVSVDSRQVKSGDLFFALKGAHADGHYFLHDAASKGASAAVVSKTFEGCGLQLPLIYVEDVLQTLQTFAKKWIEKWQPKIVAVTGSVGKTTTKDFIAAFLGMRYRVASSPGNSNSQIGLPLALLNHTVGEEEILIIEMGMTHPGNILGLVQIAPPDIALLTGTALVHACNFDSLAAIGRAKGEIFSHPKTRLGIMDCAIVNFEEIANIGTCPKISFGLCKQGVEQPVADYTLQVVDNQMLIAAPESQMTLDLLPLPGVHNRHNYLAAVAVARHFGLSWEEIRHKTPSLRLPERRLQFLEKNGILFLNDSYNASMVSVKAALESLPPPQKGSKRIAVIGEMLELGSFSEYCHREVGEYAFQYVDQMFCFGKECIAIRDCWQAAGKPVEWHLERSAIVEKLKKILSPGDVVLLKGSRSKEVWRVMEEI